MKQIKLIALSDKGEEALLKDLYKNKKFFVMVIDRQKPLVLKLYPKPFIVRRLGFDDLEYSIKKTLKKLEVFENIDYSIEVLNDE